jgi:hypothetical protein
MVLLVRSDLCIHQDLALEVYRNATIEKIAYIRHLMQRAEKDEEAHTRWQSLFLVRLPTFNDDCTPSAFGTHRTFRVPSAASRHPQGL